MQREVRRAPPEAAVVAQLAEELLYRAQALFYLVDLALTGGSLVMLDVRQGGLLSVSRTRPEFEDFVDSAW